MWERLVRRVTHAVRDVRSRRAFVYALLIAFVSQGVVTQSHFHFGLGAATAAEAQFDGNKASTGTSEKGSKHDSGDAKCPLCQAASLTGSFVAASYSFSLPVSHTYFEVRDERVIAVERFTAAWRSRAPPAL